jgi:hypothetical protein
MKMTDPTPAIGVKTTELGPAQLLYCTHHKRSIAVALCVAPFIDDNLIWGWADALEKDETVSDLIHRLYITKVQDQARLRRMISCMGLCAECMEQIIKNDPEWWRFIFIQQVVKNFAENKTKIFGAFGGNVEKTNFYGSHSDSDPDLEISFVGQIKSSIEYLCPTCIRENYLTSKSKNQFKQALLYGT